MINGLNGVSRTFSALLVPIAKHILTNTIKENPPKIATGGAYNAPYSVSTVILDFIKLIITINHKI